ncbi:MAG: sialidase family protein [Betaproteobacteria bacterium]
MPLSPHREPRAPLARALVASVAVTAAWLSMAAGAAAAVTVVEYYNPTLDHYFITLIAAEIDALDSGRIAGWGRTGLVFDAYATAADAGAAPVSPVCRFYIPPAHGDSHFLSASPAECADVRARIGTDPNFSGYIEETPAAFYIALPDTKTGACPGGTAPVFRLWNQRADSNHRYTADAATRDAMIARGYVPEGYGPLGVAMCTLRAAIADARVRVTGTSPFDPGCDGVNPTGINYAGAEVEPYVAVDPRSASHLIGVWQQDRWSDGGSRGLRTGYSFDGGLTWATSQAAFSRCTGGNAANGGDYARASDPWVTIGPDGIAYQIAISFNGATFGANSSSAVLASRSTDGGRTWSSPWTLIVDGVAPFNDKEAITADPVIAGFAYATWDRLDANGHGPSYFARTIDGGQSWQAARPIYDPGGRNQTLNNQIVVTTIGGAHTLFDFFTQFDQVGNTQVPRLAHVRSVDQGATWSGSTTVSDVRAVGTFDPQDPARKLRDAANIASFAAGPGGVLVGVWQDARFSGGARDGVAFSRSVDGGVTWSAPVQINAVPAVQALLPAVTVRNDGAIGVQYYDMRNDTADPATLLVDVWLTTSADGTAWTERHVAGPFDFNRAPVSTGGLFIGDYQGLSSGGGQFVGFFAQTNGDAANRTDIFASVFRAGGVATIDKSARTYRALPAGAFAVTPAWQRELAGAAARTLAARLMGPPDATR